MSDIIKIYTLGKFEVIKGKRILTEEVSRSSKMWKMFQYILTFRMRDVPYEELIEVLNLQKNNYPVGSLTALVYRLRKLIYKEEQKDNSNLILTRGNAYCFNNNADYWLDAEKFTKLCLKTQELIAERSSEAYDLFLKALELYNGNYLDDLKTEEWNWNARNRYRDLLVSSLYKLDEYMKDLGMYEELWQIYEQAQELIPYDEDLIVGSIEALLAFGNFGLARIKYEEVVLLYQEKGLKLPDNIKGLKSKLDSRINKDPSQHIEKMLNSRTADAAYICDQETFIRLYDLEKRRSQRKDAPRFLVHLVLENSETDRTEVQKQEEEVMFEYSDSLLEVLMNHIRRGDVVCHWSNQHFILMLINLNTSDVKKVLQRIKESFKALNISLDLNLKSRFYKI